MSVNSSSSFNGSLPSSSLSPPINMYTFLHNCFMSTVGTSSVTAFTIINAIVLLPLCVLVLYRGHRRWRQQRSGAMISHSDVFTYHMVVTELIGVLGYTLICCGVHTNVSQMMTVGIPLFVISLGGQMSFHILTCVERYLAVVHPITYLSLRNAKGIRLRNISIGCVWLHGVLSPSVMHMTSPFSVWIIAFCLISFILIVISFCSLSVLCVLIRPGPGEGGGDRQRVNQSKLRAFYTIMAILGVLLVRLGGYILSSTLYVLKQQGETERCFGWLSVIWFCLPSSLVSPLLFLQRAGKLQCCKNNK